MDMMRNNYNDAQVRETKELIDIYILHTFDSRYLSVRNYYSGSFSLRKFTFLECHRSNNTEISIALQILYIIDVPCYQNSVHKNDDNCTIFSKFVDYLPRDCIFFSHLRLCQSQIPKIKIYRNVYISKVCVQLPQKR